MIFAPFMVNVVCELLNRSKLTEHQGPLNIHSYVGQWGGGLNKIKQCYPKWDYLINEACTITGITHPIWRRFVNMNEIPGREDFDPINVLQHLLQHWRNIGDKGRHYGPYPSHYEQTEFADVCIVPMQQIQNDIINLLFEPCFKANRLSIEEFLELQRKEQESKSSECVYLITSIDIQSHPCTPYK